VSLFIASLLLLLGASALEAGSVTGKVTFEGPVPRLRPVDMNADPACAAKHSAPVAPDILTLGPGKGMKYVLVQVKNAPASSAGAPKEPAVVDQVGCRYEPHVVGVMAGQPLRFKNSDGVLHNVHGLPKESAQFNLGITYVERERCHA